jgi:hypothetical protein
MDHGVYRGSRIIFTWWQIFARDRDPTSRFFSVWCWLA